MDELIREINKYPNGTIVIVKWGNELEIKGKIDTIYETDNEMEMDKKGYQEFYSCIIDVLKILKQPFESINIEAGSLIEISMQNPPTQIMLEDNSVIWSTSLR